MELVALLAASAPKLRSLAHWLPANASASPVSALPAQLGQLSQLTSLTLGIGNAPVTTAQVDAMVQGLPMLQHLALSCSPRRHVALSDGFPVSIATSCSKLRDLAIYCGSEWGAMPAELGALTGLTRLVLAFNGMTSLPDSISRLTALQILILY